MSAVIEFVAREREKPFKAFGVMSEGMSEEGCRIRSMTILKRDGNRMVPVMLEVILEGGPDLH